MTAEEFRDTWLRQNPNIVHIPSSFEIGLMEAYSEMKELENIRLRSAIRSALALEKLWHPGYREVKEEHVGEAIALDAMKAELTLALEPLPITTTNQN